ncbi:MAG TPA: hypothetical protein VKA70_13005 [Blastocatellia bacterium]|nr:hypothetical protein [Blastocatellia bacterium]
MKPILTLLFIACLALMTAAQTPLKVCPNPAAPCQSKHKTFEKYELSFQLPRSIKPNVAYKTAPFYAVILKTFSDPECDQGEYSTATERDRQQAQKLFPDQKVFADNQCPDMGAVSYIITGEQEAFTFVAVYAGETKAEGEQTLSKAKQQYKEARVVRMQASFEQIEQ